MALFGWTSTCSLPLLRAAYMACCIVCSAIELWPYFSTEGILGSFPMYSTIPSSRWSQFNVHLEKKRVCFTIHLVLPLPHHSPTTSSRMVAQCGSISPGLPGDTEKGTKCVWFISFWHYGLLLTSTMHGANRLLQLLPVVILSRAPCSCLGLQKATVWQEINCSACSLQSKKLPQKNFLDWANWL